MNLTEKQKKEISDLRKNFPYLVFYGIRKLTPKIVRKRSIIIIYENSNIWNERKMKFIKQKMEIVAVREQTPEEISSGKNYNREFSIFEIFPDSKKYKGNLELALENNFLADENHVSEKDRNEIRNRLRKEYYKFYNLEGLQGQQALIFY